VEEDDGITTSESYGGWEDISDEHLAVSTESNSNPVKEDHIVDGMDTNKDMWEDADLAVENDKVPEHKLDNISQWISNSEESVTHSTGLIEEVYKKCPDCTVDNKVSNRFCRKCGHRFGDVEVPLVVETTEEKVIFEAVKYKKCPKCNSDMPPDDVTCNNCKNALTKRHSEAVIIDVEEVVEPEEPIEVEEAEIVEKSIDEEIEIIDEWVEKETGEVDIIKAKTQRKPPKRKREKEKKKEGIKKKRPIRAKEKKSKNKEKKVEKNDISRKKKNVKKKRSSGEK